MSRILELPLTCRRWRLAAAAIVLIAGLAAPAMAQPARDVNLEYQARVDEYLTLRKDLRRDVAPEHIIDPRIREISGALLAVRLQKARADAVEGDIIPAELANDIRDRLHRAFDPTEVDVLLMDLYPDGLPEEPTRINRHYADRVAVPPPVPVLAALPPVPGALGYRLIGCDIVLWDEDAQLVVDVVVNALPLPQVWKFLDMSSVELRRRITQALEAAHIDVDELVEDIAHDAEPGAAAPAVGEPFDWRCGSVMPPTVLYALPALPQPLEYRFVDSSLVVIDVQSGFVRGVLWNVLPVRAARPNRVML